MIEVDSESFNVRESAGMVKVLQNWPEFFREWEITVHAWGTIVPVIHNGSFRRLFVRKLGGGEDVGKCLKLTPHSSLKHGRPLPFHN